MAGARHYTELIAWQLADELRVAVFAFTRRPRFSTDFKHRGQTEDAIDSIRRNIAEGFGCESPREFARFLEIARRSLNEATDALRSAELKGYVSADELAAIRMLIRRLYAAISSLRADRLRAAARARAHPR